MVRLVCTRITWMLNDDSWNVSGSGSSHGGVH